MKPRPTLEDIIAELEEAHGLALDLRHNTTAKRIEASIAKFRREIEERDRDVDPRQKT
jgi:hypothetical protein